MAEMKSLTLALLFMGLSSIVNAQSEPAKNPAPRLPSGVFAWEKLAPKPTKNGERRDPFDAPTVTLDRLHCHVTTLKPGENTGEPHRHPQEELIVLREGTLEVNIDGKSQVATAGSVIFFAANELENMRNIGPTPAIYYVVQFFTPATPKS